MRVEWFLKFQYLLPITDLRSRKKIRQISNVYFSVSIYVNLLTIRDTKMFMGFFTRQGVCTNLIKVTPNWRRTIMYFSFWTKVIFWDHSWSNSDCSCGFSKSKTLHGYVAAVEKEFSNYCYSGFKSNCRQRHTRNCVALFQLWNIIVLINWHRFLIIGNFVILKSTSNSHHRFPRRCTRRSLTGCIWFSSEHMSLAERLGLTLWFFPLPLPHQTFDRSRKHHLQDKDFLCREGYSFDVFLALERPIT